MLAVRFIVNPRAGGGKAERVWRRLQFPAGAPEWDVVFTRGPGEATELARQAAEAGIERVVAVGGDGTVFEVANGLLGSETVLAALPGGSGNDFCCRTVGQPRDPQLALHNVFGGQVRAMDVGQINDGTIFINVAGAGFDAEVARAAARYPRVFGSGTVPYIAGILRTLWAFRPCTFTISVDGRRWQGPVLLLAVGIGQYYGGGMRVVPEARPDDGLFDICIAGDLSRWETLKTLPRIYSGTHVQNSKVRMLRGRRVEVQAERRIGVQADGELLGDLPVTIELRPAALRVALAPAGGTFDRSAG